MEKFVNWEECLELEYAKKSKSNSEYTNSLLKMADDKLVFVKSLKIDDKNSSFVFTNFYDCIRMLCEALILKKGYKIYNHKCITQFLKVVLKEEKSSRVFDACRIIRNRVSYYGKTISRSEAEKRIADIQSVYNILKNKYF